MIHWIFFNDAAEIINELYIAKINKEKWQCLMEKKIRKLAQHSSWELSLHEKPKLYNIHIYF